MKTEWTPQMMQVLRITAAYARARRSRRAARLGADQASDYRSSGATIRAAALIERSGRDPAGTRFGRSSRYGAECSAASSIAALMRSTAPTLW